jgi:sporulation protein YlmC with PRC-barrel domain
MNNEPWVVKTRNGTVWGKILRVIIDPASRQIVSVDVMLSAQDRFIRVPWKRLEVENDDIILSITEGEVEHLESPSGAGMPTTITLEDSAACNA